MAAAAFSGGSYLSLPPQRGRLKAGCRQNCPPHKLCEPGCTLGHSVLFIRNFLDDVLAVRGKVKTETVVKVFLFDSSIKSTIYEKWAETTLSAFGLPPRTARLHWIGSRTI